MRNFKKALIYFSSLQLYCAYAQNIAVPVCGFNLAQEKARQWFPSYDTEMDKLFYMQAISLAKTASATLTIPVVFHILHLDGAENITDAQVQDAVQILTRDFLKQNADTTGIVPSFKNLAANCNIAFALASKDPEGKCTNGITRHYTPRTDWKIELEYYDYSWPAAQYLNIYVVRSLPPGVAAYTYLPGTVPAQIDAIVVNHNFVGSMGTSSPGTSRVLTHEVGHWLGLPHTWGSSNNVNSACGDDGINDTPITKGFSWCNLANAAVCNPPIIENVQNYMDYSYCTRMFTLGQSAKMNSILASSISGRNNLVSAANMTTTGILNPNYNCPPKPDFSCYLYVTCVGKAHSFIDRSYNGQAQTWKWSSPAATGVSNAQNGQLTFTASGLVPVQLKAANSFGADSTLKTDYLTVLSNQFFPVNQIQDFEAANAPNNQWIATKPKYGGTFILKNNAGNSGNHSLFLNNYTDNASEAINLYSPAFNLGTVTNAKLLFNYAYAAKSNNNNDMFRVYASKDCGQNWTLIYNVSGTALNTRVNMPSPAYLVPASNEWKSETADISVFEGEQEVYLRFEFTPDATGPGNNFFIDDITISGVVGLTEHLTASKVSVYPNPSHGLFTIESKFSEIQSISLCDMIGKEVYYHHSINHKMIKLNLESISPGLYYLQLKHNNSSITVKKISIESK